MTTLLLTLLFAVILYVQVPPIIKEKNWSELSVYLLIMLTGSFYLFVYALNANVPTPTHGIAAIVKPFKIFMENILGAG